MAKAQSLQQLLLAAREQISEVDVDQVQQLQDSGWQVVDVRETEELQQGMIPGALHCCRGRLEMQLPDLISTPEQPLLLTCAQGGRSLLAARSLQQMGFQNLLSLRGGMQAWYRSGQRVDQPASAFADNSLSSYQQQRYARHLSLPEVGAAGQQRLLDSRMLIIGAGGLGSPAALYLCAAGVGSIGIVDDDRIELSNLQRQVLHSEAMCGELKTESARARLKQLNPHTQIQTHTLRLAADNVSDIINDYDLVIDGSDNYATRYLLNRACVQQHKPMVYAAVEGFSAQVAVFWPAAARDNPCYQCLFPRAGDRPSCVAAGVLGVVPGLAGMLQAIEAIKICLQQPCTLTRKLLQIDTMHSEFRLSSMRADPACSICAGESGRTSQAAAQQHSAQPGVST